MREELGVTVPALEPVGAFWYRAVDPASGLVEHEYDTVLRGRLPADPDPDPAEVSDVMWLEPGRAMELCARCPGDVTPWLAQVLETAAAPPAASAPV